jgi:hypothetical protein
MGKREDENSGKSGVVTVAVMLKVRARVSGECGRGRASIYGKVQ